MKRSLKISCTLLILFSLVAFVEKRRSRHVCQQVLVHIDNQYENYFINEQDIHRLMAYAGTETLAETSWTKLNLKKLEQRIETSEYIKKADVYSDVQGNLRVEAIQNRPIARIIQAKGPDAYISTEGKLLPVSDRYTARVMLISGPYTAQLMEQMQTTGSQIFDIIRYIDAHKFWKAQIAQLEVAKDGDIVFYPQVGKQQIEFGKAENIAEKFSKLTIFYQQILPRKGWQSYGRVNVKYQNQIVCD